VKKNQNTKNVPMRMCIVTHEKKPKNELIRIVKTVDNEVKIDPKGKERGRGANILMDEEVFEKAIKKGILIRSLKLNKKLTDKEIGILKVDFKKAIEIKKFRQGNKPVVIKIKKEQVDEVLGK